MRGAMVVTGGAVMFGVAAGWGVREVERARAEGEVVDAVEAMYEVISGAQGEARDWDAFRAGFFDARASMTFRSPSRAEDGSVSWGASSMTPDQYVERAREWTAQTGFYGRGVANRVEVYGSLAHVWSTYEARRAPEDAEPFLRGINSFQLVKTGEGWKVLSLAWEDTRSAGEIPAMYLPGGG